jgi:hypothetical protein
MNINDNKHEVRNEPYDELPTYEEVAGHEGCDHTWRSIEGDGIEECIWCGEEREFFMSLEKLAHMKEQ